MNFLNFLFGLRMTWIQDMDYKSLGCSISPKWSIEKDKSSILYCIYVFIEQVKKGNVLNQSAFVYFFT